MFCLRHLCCLILLRSIIALPNLYMYYTDDISSTGADALHYHCFHIPMAEKESITSVELFTYCINELSPRFHVQPTGYISNLTFAQLSKRNISSKDLYTWFAPIDLIERYQLYLNAGPRSVDTMMEEEVFFNCSEERFGPMCQYELKLDETKANTDILNYAMKFYQHANPFTHNLTCYVHLQCDRGPSPSCLDWSEICDGIVHCLDGSFDEKHCPQVDMNNTVSEPVQEEYTVNGQKLILPTMLVEDARCRELPLTSSCVSGRQERLFLAMFSANDPVVSDSCSSAFKCILPVPPELRSICNEICHYQECLTIIDNECPPMFNLPATPILFGNIYFAHEKTDSRKHDEGDRQDPYICYENSLYDDHFSGSQMSSLNGRHCHRANISEPSNRLFWLDLGYLQLLYKIFEPYNRHSTTSSAEAFLIPDDDYPKIHCSSNTQVPSIDHPYPHDGEYLYYSCDDDNNHVQPQNHHIPFHYICNRHIEVFPRVIDGRDESDETECDLWPCNNLHTRCNNFWNCLNGEDEFHCATSLQASDSSDDYKCVSAHTKQWTRLSMNRIDDGHIDCLGAMDERTVCHRNSQSGFNHFYCQQNRSGTCINITHFCDDWTDSDITHVCPELDFLHGDVVSTPSQENIRRHICQPVSIEKSDNNIIPSKPFAKELNRLETTTQCYRGLPVRLRLSANQSKVICFCPLSYYGEHCEHQNQRVSLALHFQAFSDSRQTLFEIIVQLIDDSNERVIHSHVQFTYLFLRDCATTFRHYLLYSTRSKDQSKTYSVHVDIYEQQSLSYRASLWFPIVNTFLPVHRLNLTIQIPPVDFKGENCLLDQCVHGECIRYSNSQHDESFCQCYPQWLGKYCTIPYARNCTCSPDSLCLGLDAHNRSICACPMYKSGPRCYIEDTKCELKDKGACDNDGQCIPPDLARQTSQSHTCICSQGLHGDRCELEENKVSLSFETTFPFVETILVHLIKTERTFISKRTTTFRKVFSMREPVVFRWSDAYNLILIEDMSKNYYFIDSQDLAYDKIQLSRQVKLSDRCLHVNELLDRTTAQYHLLRRIKYYHLPCQSFMLNSSCFYDDVHLCFCYDHEGQRLTNCFQFNHTMKFDCLGENECINGGQCFQVGSKCSKKSTCLCHSCFYGRRCQFISSRFSVSLDNILGYQIHPSIALFSQADIIKTSIIVSIVFTIVGLINGISTMITFKNEELRGVGCGLYLFGASIATLMVTSFFTLKFWILIYAQMSLISNRSFLKMQCVLLEYLIHVFSHVGQWLTACVACERAVTIIQGTRFSKKKSKKLAKYVIILLFILNILMFIYEPIYRHLIDEVEEDGKGKRIWCAVNYSSGLQTYNSIINTFQFFAPFIINLVSAFILITKRSRQQSSIQKKRNFKDILKANYREHKHLFIAPVLLVVLAIPRLIISYASRCMQSSEDSWLFLWGYFISLIPSMLTFMIFVVPSKLYKREFYKSVSQYRTAIKRHFRIL